MEKNKLNKFPVDIFSVLPYVSAVIVPAAAVYLFVGVSRYAELSMSLVLAVVLVLLAVVLLNFTLVFSSLIFKKNMVLKVVMTIVALVLTVSAIYGGSVLSRLNASIDSMVDTEEPVDEMITSYFIVYDNENADGIDYLNNKKVGIIGNDQILEGNVFAKAEIEKQGLTVEYVDYQSYQEMLFGLFAGEIDVASVATSYMSSFTTDDGQDDNLKLTKVIHEYDSKATVSTSTKTDVDLTEPFSMLVIGVDSLNAGNSDVLILATFNPNTLDITLTSIARDSFVPISCYGGANNKINAARTSRQCLIDTVEDLMDVDINFYFETNFKGVVDIVDALGGIIINSEKEFVGQDSSLDRGNYTVWIPEGEYFANGEEVLAFIRERHAFPDGDFARQRHQQQVLTTMLEEMLKLNSISKILDVIEAAGENVSTNMSLGQMKELLTYCLNVYNTNYDKDSRIFDIQSSRLTGYSSWTYNERLEMRLWIYKLFKGSISDNREIILKNLEIEKDLTYPKPLNIAMFDIWRSSKATATYYNEKQEHEPMPAFVEVFAGKHISEMQSWASQHGLGLNITYVSEGDGYSSDLADGTVISQSVSSGRVALISSIDVRVIKHPLDCSLEENAGNEACQNVYINAVEKNIDTVIEWAKQKGVTLSFNVITAQDSGYDAKKAGLVKSQTERAYSKFNDSKSMGVTYYEKLTAQFLNESGVEIANSKISTLYGKVIKEPTYTCANKEHAFKGWINTATNSLFDFSQGLTSSVKLQASCVAPVKHTVTFVYEGPTGKTETKVQVTTGSAATAPDASREGYTYKWDKDFSKITGDMTVTAVYTPVATPTPTPSATPTPSTTPSATPTPTPTTTPTTPTCGENEELVDGVCKPKVPTCAEGEKLVDGVCKPVCPTCGDTSHTTHPEPTCPEGQTLVDGACVTPAVQEPSGDNNVEQQPADSTDPGNE